MYLLEKEFYLYQKKQLNSQKIKKTKEAEELKKYRATTGAGPCFFLSYQDAKNPNHPYCQRGPEVLLGCKGKQQNNISSESIPLIIHCAIPFSILPDFKYYVFCILRAYFIFIDPEDDSGNLFEGYSIDLMGKALDQQHIVKVEEL